MSDERQPPRLDAEGENPAAVRTGKLQDGLNFYDHPPFADVIAGVVAQYSDLGEDGMRIEDMKHDLTFLMTKYARALAVYPTVSDRIEVHERFMVDVVSNMPEGPRRKRYMRFASQGQALAGAMGAVIEGLSSSVLWTDYVAAKHDQGYKPNGEPKLKKMRNFAPPTYDAWIVTERVLEKKIRDGWAHVERGRIRDPRLSELPGKAQPPQRSQRPGKSSS